MQVCVTHGDTYHSGRAQHLVAGVCVCTRSHAVLHSHAHFRWAIEQNEFFEKRKKTNKIMLPPMPKESKGNALVSSLIVWSGEWSHRRKSRHCSSTRHHSHKIIFSHWCVKCTEVAVVESNISVLSPRIRLHFALQCEATFWPRRRDSIAEL